MTAVSSRRMDFALLVSDGADGLGATHLVGVEWPWRLADSIEYARRIESRAVAFA